MAVQRTILIAGPAKVVRGTLVTHTQDDVQINFTHSTFPVTNAAFGTVDHHSLDQIVEATFTPAGNWNATNSVEFFPHIAKLPGTSLLTTSDIPTTFHGTTGTTHIFKASAITQMPSLTLSAAGTMLGPMTITGVRATNTEYDAADSMYSVVGTPTFTDTAFNPREIVVQNYSAVWGGTTDIPGFSASTPFNTQDGWTIDFQMSYNPIVVDELGTVDLLMGDLIVKARCIPIGPTEAQIIAAANLAGSAGGAIKRGQSISSAVLAVAAPDLVITGDDATTIVTLKEAGMTGCGFMFGSSSLRYGECEWTARRTFATGALSAIVTLAP